METFSFFTPRNCDHPKSIPEISVYAFSKITIFSYIFHMVYGGDSQNAWNMWNQTSLGFDNPVKSGCW